MKEFFLPVDLAALAKRKGFDEPCMGYWEKSYRLDQKFFPAKLVINQDSLILSEEEEKRKGMYQTSNQNSLLPQFAISAPTYDQMLDWLDKKKIILQVHLLAQFEWDKGWAYELTYQKDGEIYNTDESKTLRSRRSALKDGIQKALRLF